MSDEQMNGYCVKSISEGLTALKDCVKDKLLLSGVDISELTDYGVLLYATVLIDSMHPSGNGYLHGFELTEYEIDIVKRPPPPPPLTHEQKIELWKADMGSYYKSSYWRSIRAKMLDYGALCTACDSHNHLVVHHLNYDTIGKEDEGNLEVLCRSCHTRAHKGKRIT